MKSNNTLTLDFAGNEDLKAALGGLGVGEEYCITVCGKVVSVDDQTFEGSVDEITPEEGGEASDVSDDEPVMLMLMGKKAKKVSAPKEEKGEEEEPSA